VVIDAHPRKHRTLEQPAPAEPEPAPPVEDEPPPLDEPALQIASLLRSDGREPRTDNELADAAGLSATEAGERLRRLAAAGQAVRVARNLHFHPEPLAELEARVIALCERDGSATIASVRDELGTSRKYAQALLEHLDGEKVTRRDGDAHTLRGR
jgi:selenocysteine-specific elongation factor